MSDICKCGHRRIMHFPEYNRLLHCCQDECDCKKFEESPPPASDAQGPEKEVTTPGDGELSQQENRCFYCKQLSYQHHGPNRDWCDINSSFRRFTPGGMKSPSKLPPNQVAGNIGPITAVAPEQGETGATVLLTSIELLKEKLNQVMLATERKERDFEALKSREHRFVLFEQFAVALVGNPETCNRSGEVPDGTLLQRAAELADAAMKRESEF